MSAPILNIHELELTPFDHDERYQAQIGHIGPKIGAQKLGYNLTVLAPGKRAFPAHNHWVNEEMFFIVEGEGVIRIGEHSHPIRAGDVIACPVGGPDSAHQIINTSDVDELRYLAVSTRQSPDVVDYPDTGKFGLLAEMPPDAEGNKEVLRFVGKPGESLDYWDGE